MLETAIIQLEDLARTFNLNARVDTHIFLDRNLPAFLEDLGTEVRPLRYWIESLRSGEYIPKASYSDTETEYVYMTIGQFSGDHVTFEQLTFLDDAVGESFEGLTLQANDLVVTRSGTVGRVHVFVPQDNKTYIPSHHLAVVRINSDAGEDLHFLRVFLQSEFAREYFWAFASGKGQKEISNWSIRSIPIPVVSDSSEIAQAVLDVEERIRAALIELERLNSDRELILKRSIQERPV